MVSMSSFNQVTLLGNLTRGPELRYLPGGDTAVVEVPIAVNERYRKDGELVESVSFIDVTFFGRTAEVVNEYLTKGSPVLVSGKLKQDRWEKDGEKRSKLKVVCQQMQLVGAKRTADQQETADTDSEPVGVGTDEDQF